MVMSANPYYSGIGSRREYFNLYESPDAVTIEADDGDDYVSGSSKGDLIYGQGGRDIVWSGSGDDTVFGDWSQDDVADGFLSGGADFIVSGDGVDTVYAGVGDDYVNGCEGDDHIFGGDGRDTLFGSLGRDTVDGGAGNDIIYGAAANVLPSKSMETDWDGITGEAAEVGHNSSGGYIPNDEVMADKLLGGEGNDRLYGQGGDDKLFGGEGSDWLTGGLGADTLRGGGGLDRFVFASKAESTVSAQGGSTNASLGVIVSGDPEVSTGRDCIMDFSQADGDLIDFAGIDADKSMAGNQAFNFIGKKAFSGDAGELRYVAKDGDTFIYGDMNGDQKADFAVQLKGLINFTLDDFIL